MGIKKILIFIISIIGIGLLILTSFFHPSLEVLVSDQSLSFKPYTLYFKSIKDSRIKGFDTTSSGLSPSEKTFLSFTEGVMEQGDFKLVASRLPQNKPLHLHFFKDFGPFKVYSFIGDLSHFYILDETQNTLSTPIYTAPENLGPMYTSHSVLGDSVLYVTALKPNSYNGFIYGIDLNTYQVVFSKELSLNPKVQDHHDLSITDSGLFVFLDDLGLTLYDSVLDHQTALPLSYEADGLFAIEDTFSTLHITSESLSIESFDSEYNVIEKTSFTLPTSTANIIDFLATDTHLALLLRDPNGIRFSHYFVVYDRTDQTMVYCLGFEPDSKWVPLSLSLALKEEQYEASPAK